MYNSKDSLKRFHSVEHFKGFAFSVCILKKSLFFFFNKNAFLWVGLK